MSDSGMPVSAPRRASWRRRLRSCGDSRLFGLCSRLLDRIVPDRRTNLLRVLTYHRVAEVSERPDLDPSLISATPDQFRRQMQIVADRFRPVALSEVVAAFRGGRCLPPRAVLITFDDAYLDFAEHAWPAMQRLEIPATLFVPTAFPDQPERSFWWDRLHGAIVRGQDAVQVETPFGMFPLDSEANRAACFARLKQRLKSLPDGHLHETVDWICEQTSARQLGRAVLGWPALERIAGEGVTLAPHTHTHCLLNRVTADTVREEVCRSRDELESHVGQDRVGNAFAYPSGYYDRTTVDVLRDERFATAFTTRRGMADCRSADPLRIHRINVGRRTSDELLRFQLCGATRLLNARVGSSFPKTAAAVSSSSGSSPTCHAARPCG